MGLGLGLVFAPSFNTGTFGVPPADAGVASATVNTGQQLGGSIGTSLLNTIFAGAVASYLTAHISPATAIHGLAQSATDRTRADPRLQHRLLVLRRHPDLRRDRRRHAPALRAAHPGRSAAASARRRRQLCPGRREPARMTCGTP